MTPDRIAATLADDARLIVPVGTCAQYHPSLPLGCATIFVERLADDLSAEFAVLRAPSVEYGVNSDKIPAYPGQVSVRKKTLHRLLNDTLAAWEAHGVNEIILLTAHPYDPHHEAIETVATSHARVRVVDTFSVNLSDLVGTPKDQYNFGNLFVSLMLFLAPTLVRNLAPGDGSAELGEALYKRIHSRISERIFLAPTPTE